MSQDSESGAVNNDSRDPPEGQPQRPINTEPFRFLKGTSYVLFAGTVTTLFSVYEKEKDKANIPLDYQNVSSVFTVTLPAVSFALGLGIQCNGLRGSAAQFAVGFFVIMLLILIFSLSFAMWVCMYPHGYWQAPTFFGVCLLVLFFLWIRISKKPKCLYDQLAKCAAYRESLKSDDLQHPDKSYDFMKLSAFYLYGLILAIFYGVFHHVKDQKSLPHGYHTSSFIFLIAAIGIGFFLFLLIQIYDHMELSLPAIWSFILLLVMALFSVSYAVWVCLYPNGKVAASVLFSVGTTILLTLWPVMFKKPEILRVFLLMIKRCCSRHDGG